MQPNHRAVNLTRLLCAALCVAITTGASGQTLYSITDIGDLGSAWGYTDPLDINNRGEVVGFTYNPMGRQVAFLYTGGKISAITDDYSIATSINDAGQVVGSANRSGAFAYSNGAFTHLTWLRGRRYGLESALPKSINNKGQILGFGEDLYDNRLYYDPRPSTYAVLWNGSPYANGIVRVDSAVHINDAGQIVGSFRPYIYPIYNPPWNSWVYHAYIMDKDDGILHDLGVLPGASPLTACSTATAINDNGDVVGDSWTATTADGTHGYFYHNGQMIEIGSGWRESHALDVNNFDEVVGWADFSAILYKDGELYDLNDLIPADSAWRLMRANAINDLGQIVGYGYHGSYIHAFLLTPLSGGPNPAAVPEPGPLALLAAMAIPAIAWRRKQRIGPRLP